MAPAVVRGSFSPARAKAVMARIIPVMVRVMPTAGRESKDCSIDDLKASPIMAVGMLPAMTSQAVNAPSSYLTLSDNFSPARQCLNDLDRGRGMSATSAFRNTRTTITVVAWSSASRNTGTCSAICFSSMTRLPELLTGNHSVSS